MPDKKLNQIKLILFTALLGGSAGAVVWCFLKAVSFLTGVIWETLPQKSGLSFLPVLVCALGGLCVGVMHKKYGNYPEELAVVMKKIKEDKYYEYKHMAAMLLCALIPLVLCSSVGPEAGLTGIIAALCYWVGDNVSFARGYTGELSEISEAVTLGQIFRSPLFGILAVEKLEDENRPEKMQKRDKLLYYGISTASGFFIVRILNTVFGKAMEGFPSFSEGPSGAMDYALLLLYIPVGLLLFILFEAFEKLTKKLGGHIPVILKELLCGIVIGLTGLFLPMVMGSGEEQMAELMETFAAYTPLFLAAICILKLLMTAFCINLGMKGGHFFPLIFACTCMGFTLSMLIFPEAGSHAAFASAAVTATVLGAQLKKPFAAAFLLLLCFPAELLLWSFLCAAAGSKAAALIEGKIPGGVAK